VSSGATLPFVIERLGDHERASFRSDVPELDRYLHVQARQDAKRRVAAPFVMVGADGRVMGYYTLSAYGILVAELTPEIAKKLPKYPVIPATLLGRFAMDREYQGRKLARLLLMDALYRSWKNTAEVASVGVVAEAIDDRARGFYLHHHFIPLGQQGRKLFIAMGTIEKSFL
jgi:GNAT superfamily N-acetyltransferase